MGGLYNGIDSPVLATYITNAEIIKYTGNVFLATRISFVNEIASICDRVGASIDDVSKGLALIIEQEPGYLPAPVTEGHACRRISAHS